MSSEKRSDFNRFLVGQINDPFPVTQLATRRDILKYLFFKKYKAQKDSNSNCTPALNPLDCCPFKTGSTEASCGEKNGCSSEDMCVVRCAKVAWADAGFLTVSDIYIRYYYF